MDLTGTLRSELTQGNLPRASVELVDRVGALLVEAGAIADPEPSDRLTAGLAAGMMLAAFGLGEDELASQAPEATTGVTPSP
jgi:hypothetical protein